MIIESEEKVSSKTRKVNEEMKKVKIKNRNIKNRKIQQKNRKVKPQITGKFSVNDIYNNVPTMIHEKDYVPMDCVLCGTQMKTIHDTASPHPITEECYAKEAHETGNPNRCCQKCDKTYVLPARMYCLQNGLNFHEKEEGLFEMVKEVIAEKKVA
jgi:hypothetical protein